MTQVSKATLIFLITDTHILLAPKLKKVGVGKLNGYGGRVKQGEAILQAAVRELLEESTVRVSVNDLEYMAKVTASETNEEIWEIDVFTTRRWEGVPQATAEMGEPRWYTHGSLRDLELNQGDLLWMTQMLHGRRQTVHLIRRNTQQETSFSMKCFTHDVLKMPR